MSEVVRFFQEGGVFMYPIAIIMAVGVAIAIERVLVLIKERSQNKQAFGVIAGHLQKANFDAAAKAAEQSPAKISRMMALALARLNAGQQREQIEYALEEGLMEAIPQLEKRTQYIATLANVATLLGLLGTIMGLISAFAAVANAVPAEKASLLSESIAMAMNTTAFGLIVAIPLLLAHSFVQSKTSEIVDSLEMAGVKFLNALATDKS